MLNIDDSLDNKYLEINKDDSELMKRKNNFEDEVSNLNFNKNENENEKTISESTFEDEVSKLNFNKNENEKTISESTFEDEVSKLNFSKNENEKEKTISQDILEEGRQNYCGNFNKNKNEKNFYNDKSNDNNEINKLSSYESSSPKLYLDLSTEHCSLLSDGESNNDLNLPDEKIFKNYENSVINDKSNEREKVKKKKKNKNQYKSYIKGVNKSFSNSDNHDIKLMNPIFPNCILLKEKKEYYYIMNEKFSNLNEKQAKDLDSQKSFSDYKYNNRSNLPNESQSDSYSNNDDNNDNSEQSNGSSSSFTSLEVNTTPFNRECSFKRKYNKKRRRTRNKVSNSFPININNSKNTLELLSNENIYEVNIKILEIDKNGNKKGIFEIYKTRNRGRKKKNSEETGKHTKISKDNLRSKAKTISLDFLLPYFNKKIKEIDINDLNKNPDWRLYKTKYVDNKTKVYNLDLLNQSLKSIFSAPITGRSDKNENYNKDLIDKIYQINQEENSEKTEKIIKIFNMKYKDFFNYVKVIKEQEKIEGIDEDIKDMVKKFYFFLEEKLSKDNKDKNYNQKLIELIKNFPEDIKNMIVKKKKKE